VACLQILSHFVEGLKKSTKNFDHAVRISSPNLAPGTPTYEEGTVLETERRQERKFLQLLIGGGGWSGGVADGTNLIIGPCSEYFWSRQ
jgi:hypothetical protein